MKLIFTWKELIILNGTTEIARYPATSKVRNELNGLRKKDQIVYTCPVTGRPKPYYPRPYPSGIHMITAIEWLTDPKQIDVFGPVKIRTTATRDVFTWDLDREGKYWKPTGKIQVDGQYHIHHTHKYIYTHGCIRGGSTTQQMISIAKIVEPVLNAGEKVHLEVL